ncbi:MAG: CoA-binding protein [Chlorobi bacterium]|nr:CoA-binding protein [Chlorobiota bacterium]MCI0715920.1 CoA-binding protein [Chlorobiota bacterium]
MDLTREILENSKSIAVIGLKNDESVPAYKVPYYMQKHGYKIYPVNPKLEGKKVLGENSYNIVTEIKDKIDVVNIFRKPEYLISHAKEILQMDSLPKYVWFQLGIYNDEAAKILKEKGIKVVQNRCIMVEHTKL